MAQADVADAQLVERHRRHPHQAVGGLMGFAEVAGARIDAELVGVDEIEGDYRVAPVSTMKRTGVPSVSASTK